MPRVETPATYKVQPPRRSQKYTSTEERQFRAVKVESAGLEIVAKCDCCKEKGLRCFVNIVSRQCAGYIAIKAEYSLFISNKD